MTRKFGTVSGLDLPPKGMDLGLANVLYATGTAAVWASGGNITGLAFTPNVVFATAGGGAWWYYNKGAKIRRSAYDGGAVDISIITNGFYVQDPNQGSQNMTVTYVALLIP